MAAKRDVLLVQLPIPPAGVEPIRGNVPLAAGYLKMLAERRGLGERYQIEILPTRLANALGDVGLVEAIATRRPWLVGFTCYLWNIDRTLWIAAEVKRRSPGTLVLIGGPEVAADNAWVLSHPAIDYAAIGEGEQTFSELLAALADHEQIPQSIDGLFVRRGLRPAGAELHEVPNFRKPMANLTEASSPYLAGILDAADEEMLLLETIRGCVFKCKFCYYPKSYDSLYFVAEEKIVANLRHARERGAREVVLLDPTLNQRRDFGPFLQLLARENPDRQFTYFGELRAEGINAENSRLMREANFSEVEIGLQSIDPLAMDLMDRNNNLRAFEKGARAMLDAGIQVKVDLIIGLPGDTVESVRRGIHYIRDSGLYSSVQVFNLAILPGTAFRHEARELGLEYQPRTPYYVFKTPTLTLAAMHDLMVESQEIFETEFDPLPDPVLEFTEQETWDADDARQTAQRGLPPGGVYRAWRVDLDQGERTAADVSGPAANEQAQAFTLWLTARDFGRQRRLAAGLIGRILADNPHTTLQVILAPRDNPVAITPAVLDELRAACFRETSYLDRFYSVAPGKPKGAKRLVIVWPWEERSRLPAEWQEDVSQYAEIVWLGAPADHADDGLVGAAAQ